jgi:trehalose 6-phosphate phosphatase
LFLDVDGTILTFADRPEAVFRPPGLLPLLQRLRRALGGALALVSGRDLTSIDQLFTDPPFDAAGCHGAEIRIGNTVTPLARTADRVPELARRLEMAAGAIPGVIIERKAHSVALHYRLSRIGHEVAWSLAATALGEDTDRFRIIAGHRVVEIIPRRVDKGTAIDHFVTSPNYAGRRPVFVGDDITDEDGFTAVNRWGGISIRVGELGASAARFRLSTVPEVWSWLAGPLWKAVSGPGDGVSDGSQ